MLVTTPLKLLCEVGEPAVFLPDKDGVYRIRIVSAARVSKGVEAEWQWDFSWRERYVIVFLDTDDCLKGSSEHKFISGQHQSSS